MHKVKTRAPLSWSCCGCGHKIKYGEAYTWWWMPNLIRCETCRKEMTDSAREVAGKQCMRGVREKPIRTGINSKKPIKGEMLLFD